MEKDIRTKHPRSGVSSKSYGIFSSIINLSPGSSKKNGRSQPSQPLELRHDDALHPLSTKGLKGTPEKAVSSSHRAKKSKELKQEQKQNTGRGVQKKSFDDVAEFYNGQNAIISPGNHPSSAGTFEDVVTSNGGGTRELPPFYFQQNQQHQRQHPLPIVLLNQPPHHFSSTRHGDFSSCKPQSPPTASISDESTYTMPHNARLNASALLPKKRNNNNVKKSLQLHRRRKSNNRKKHGTPNWITSIFDQAKIGIVDESLMGLEPTIIRNLVDSRGNNLLHAFAKSGHLINIQYLVFLLGPEADSALKDVNKAGRNVLLTCLKFEKLKCFQWLALNTDYGRQSINPAMTKRAKYLIHYAAGIYNSIDALRFLAQKVLEHNGMLDIKDPYGRSPLHFAAKHGNMKIIQELIYLGSDPLSETEFGLKPSDMAYRHKHVECANYLILSECAASMTTQIQTLVKSLEKFENLNHSIQNQFKEVLRVGKLLVKDRTDLIKRSATTKDQDCSCSDHLIASLNGQRISDLEHKIVQADQFWKDVQINGSKTEEGYFHELNLPGSTTLSHALRSKFYSAEMFLAEEKVTSVGHVSSSDEDEEDDDDNEDDDDDEDERDEEGDRDEGDERGKSARNESRHRHPDHYENNHENDAGSTSSTSSPANPSHDGEITLKSTQDTLCDNFYPYQQHRSNPPWLPTHSLLSDVNATFLHKETQLHLVGVSPNSSHISPDHPSVLEMIEPQKKRASTRNAKSTVNFINDDKNGEKCRLEESLELSAASSDIFHHHHGGNHTMTTATKLSGRQNPSSSINEYNAYSAMPTHLDHFFSQSSSSFSNHVPLQDPRGNDIVQQTQLLYTARNLSPTFSDSQSSQNSEISKTESAQNHHVQTNHAGTSTLPNVYEPLLSHQLSSYNQNIPENNKTKKCEPSSPNTNYCRKPSAKKISQLKERGAPAWYEIDGSDDDDEQTLARLSRLDCAENEIDTVASTQVNIEDSRVLEITQSEKQIQI